MIFLFLFLFLSSPRPVFAQVEKNIKNTSIDLMENAEEVQLKLLLKEIVTLFSISKDIDIKIKNSAQAIEYEVVYSPEDQKELTLLSGIRQRMIRELFNELSIAVQKQYAEKNKRRFRYEDRKILLVTFHNRGNH
ncbi:MAG: hypothetical protein JNM93_09295 [Bacteriovoracaceae bacterium]|nr:hypothetical protein [Bacteriovoracaceae bacterium]